MSKVIGIDLGTGNSCVSVVQAGKPTVITNAEGSRTTPSVVGFLKTGQKVVGQIARRQATINPTNTIYSIKRLIGHSYNQVKDQKVPYKIVGGVKDQAHVHIDTQNKNYSPQQISAMILKKMKDTAELYLGEPVTQAVITVPAYFGDDQRTATKDAGRIAGLEVLRIINEPTAAALAYGINSKKSQKVAIYDFGSGTFDISILDISDGVIEVLSTNGNTKLGGDDIDNVLIEWIVGQFKKTDGIDISKDNMALQRIKQAAQKAKIQLSGTITTNINLPFITADSTGPRHLSLDLSRSKFESMISNIIQETITPCKQALQDSKLSLNDIDEVLLVGGSTRIPAVQEAVKKFFGKEPNKSLNPDEVVAMGAAIQGSILSGDDNMRDILLLDVTPLSLGIQTVGGVMTTLITRNTTIPARKTQVFSTATDNQPAVGINVLQGERSMAADNKSLGKFDLTDIPPAPKGVPQIEVTFDIDSNGIIHVSAKDKGTGRSQSIKIQRSSQLSQNEVQSMIKQAEKYAEQDKVKRQNIEAKNNLDSIMFQVNKSIEEYKDKVPSQLIEKLQSKYNQINNKLPSISSTQEYNNCIEQLNKVMQQIGSHIYSNQQNNQQQTQSQTNQNKKKQPIDADFQIIN